VVKRARKNEYEREMDAMNVLAFFAHPDDETMLAGGTLALLAEAGAAVHYLSATRGEGGELGEPPLTTQAALGSFREKELMCAVQALGGKSLTFLDYQDPKVGVEDELYAYTDDMTLLSKQVLEVLHQQNIDVLISHGSNGEYGHPAHVVTYQAARLAAESFSAAGLLFYTVSASFDEHPRPFLTNQDDPADLILDISPALARKTQAALCHRTQHALFVRKASEEAGHRMNVQEVIITVEGLHRALPPGSQALDDPLTKLLSPYLLHP
jgi:LmbE family N-acetylglucosaminyl deacetylase